MAFRFIRDWVESQFSAPSVPLAFLFFLLPFAFLLGFRLVFRLPVDFAQILFGAIAVFAEWVAAAALLYVLLLAFKGKEARGKLFPVFTSFSVVYLIDFVAAAVMSVVLYFSLPDLFRKIPLFIGASPEEAIGVVSGLSLPSETIVYLAIALLLVIGLAAFAARLFVVFRVAEETRKTTAFSNIVLIVVFLGLMLVANMVLELVTGLVFAG